MKYGYARVSTDDQNVDMQLKALKRDGCKKIFTDEGISGTTAKRPALLRLLKIMQRGDTVVLWKLDRLARSLPDLVRLMNDFKKRGIQFRSLTETFLNTDTPGGELVFHIFAAMAQFEHGVIKERTRAGISAARNRGVKFGRKKKLTDADIARARKLIDRGERPADVAASFKVGRSTLYRDLEQAA